MLSPPHPGYVSSLGRKQGASSSVCLPFVRAVFPLGGGFLVFVCIGKRGSVVCSLAGDLLMCPGVWEEGLWVIPVEETVSFSHRGESGADSRGETFPSLFLRGWGLCICHSEESARLSPGRGRCLRISISVCLSSGAERAGETWSFFLQQPLSAQPWEVLPPACQAQPRALRHCCRSERVPAPWRRAPLAAAVRSAAPQAVSRVYAAAAHADAESFLRYSGEVKEP